MSKDLNRITSQVLYQLTYLGWFSKDRQKLLKFSFFCILIKYQCYYLTLIKSATVFCWVWVHFLYSRKVTLAWNKLDLQKLKWMRVSFEIQSKLYNQCCFDKECTRLNWESLEKKILMVSYFICSVALA